MLLTNQQASGAFVCKKLVLELNIQEQSQPPFWQPQMPTSAVGFKDFLRGPALSFSEEMICRLETGVTGMQQTGKLLLA